MSSSSNELITKNWKGKRRLADAFPESAEGTEVLNKDRLKHHAGVEATLEYRVDALEHWRLKQDNTGGRYDKAMDFIRMLVSKQEEAILELTEKMNALVENNCEHFNCHERVSSDSN